ncbi:putative ubiquitin-conjugating enzyme E2 [Arachis hypogaea]|nr:putative ubiquitin-conjugating enzyme E2 [Arachis hypogaea]
MLWLVPHQMIFLSGIMCWRELKECLLQVDITMERSNFLQNTHSNHLDSVCPESWKPMWSVSSILTGFLWFMMDDSPTTGSVNTMTAEQHLAKSSLAFN